MKETDLELFRWNWYRLRIRDIKANRNAALGLRTFWSEYGVFVSTLPRQSGKSEMIIKMAEALENNGEAFLIIVLNENMKRHLSGMAPNIYPGKIRTNPGAMMSFYRLGADSRPEDTHILIDEYEHLHNQAMGWIMNENWKSISLIGSYKLRAT